MRSPAAISNFSAPIKISKQTPGNWVFGTSSPKHPKVSKMGTLSCPSHPPGTAPVPGAEGAWKGAVSMRPPCSPGGCWPGWSCELLSVNDCSTCDSTQFETLLRILLDSGHLLHCCRIRITPLLTSGLRLFTELSENRCHALQSWAGLQPCVLPP